MTLLSEVETYFGTKDLYEVLGLDKSATESEIKKAYRKVSLKVHPDRVAEPSKEEATKKFQTLARVHYVLSDQEHRNLYDNQGIIANEDDLDGQADWSEYWRLLFPKISEKDISNFLDTYIGSKEEEEDLIKVYNKYNGDMDKICDTHIAFDEDRTEKQILDLIADGKLQETSKFSNNRQIKKAKRIKKSQREAKEAAKLKEELAAKRNTSADSMSDLTALIQSKGKASFDSLISNLEAKYATKPKTNKRKRP